MVSEQALDVRSMLSILRRRRRLLVVLGLCGALAGAGPVFLVPAHFESTSQVLLAPDSSGSGDQSDRDSDTEIRVASSDVVLGPAGRAAEPPLSLREMDRRVVVTAPTKDVLEITARGDTAKAAELLAGAVAEAEVAYQAKAASSLTAAQQQALSQRGEALQAALDTVNSEVAKTRTRLKDSGPASRQGRADSTALADLTAQQGSLSLQIDALKDRAANADVDGVAQVIQEASPAKRSNFVVWLVAGVLLGGLAALLLACLLLVAFGRRDRRLRTRDEIADALGSVVLGSLRSQSAGAAAAWTSLIETYEPTVTDAWSLRQILHHVGLGQLTMRAAAEGARPKASRTKVLTLITLSDDPRALAVGPQLSSHAASLGVRTRVVADQGHDSAASLWAACSELRHNDEVRPGLWVDTRRRGGVDLTVKLVVVDRRQPQFVELNRTGVTLVAVSSGSATAEDLARTAVAAYEAGGRISGVIVADPDGLDATTGRLLLQQRFEQPPLPVRMTGVESAARAGGKAPGGRGTT